MDPVESPHLATLRAVADRVADTRALPPAPLTAVRRRARHLRRRRQVGSGLAVLAVAGVGAVAVVGRPAPSEQVSFGVSPDGGPGGTAPPGTAVPAAPLTTVPGVAPVYVRIFMHPVATRDQIDGLRAQLEMESGIGPVAFVNQQQAYEEFQEMFRDSPEMVESVRPEVLPTSFIVDVGGNEARAEVLAAKARTRAGVKEAVVVDHQAGVSAVRDSLAYFLTDS